MILSEPQEPTIQSVIESARLERRKTRWINVGFGLSILILLGAIVYVITNYQPETACQVDPTSRECQKLKIESDKDRTPRSACVITRRAGLGCPVLQRRRERLQKEERASDDPSKQNAGTQSRGGGGEGDPVGDGGNGSSDGTGPSSPAPTTPDPQPPSPPDPPYPTPPNPPQPPQPTPDNPSLGSGIDSTLDGVNEVVEGTKGTVCNVAGVCLP